MRSIAQVKELLRTIARTGQAASPDATTPAPSPALVAAARVELIGLLAALARERSPDALGAVHKFWTQPGVLERYLREVLGALATGLGAGADEAVTRDLVLECLRQSITGALGEHGLLEGLEIHRAAATAYYAVLAHLDADWARNYAIELGLVRWRSLRLTTAGETLLELTGAEAIEWLICLEMERSLGDDDPWRISRSNAAELFRRRACYANAGQWLGIAEVAGDLFELEESAALRMDTFGLINVRDVPIIVGVDDTRPPPSGCAPDECGWTLTPLGERVLRSALADPPGPLALLARAVTQDDLRALTQPPVPASSTQQFSFDYARMVVHEIRNAVGPIRVAFDRIITRPDLPPEQRAELADRVRRGLTRLEEFGDKASRIAALGGRKTRIPLPDAIEEALRATEAERNGRVRVERRLSDAVVWGDRERFVIALVNLVRNAAQVGPTLTRLEVSVNVRGDAVELSFSDDGPGVPDEAASRLFDAGFSLRGGTGLGLHFVRQVIQEEMSGEVRYAPANHGGACFILVLPLFGGGEP